jgi:DNA-binding transcriptional MerR regulator
MKMKMKELENRTGVGRETIRYYIREGLLPEPQKPTQTIAHYSEAHVERIRLIKTLQDEQFLPLKEIRSILEDADRGREGALDLLGLEFRLAARTGMHKRRRRLVIDVLHETKLNLKELEDLKNDGLIDFLDDEEGRWLSGQDIEIVEQWVNLKRSGYSEQLGYSVQDLRRYKEAALKVAAIEVEEFFDRVSGKSTAEEASVLGADGLAYGEKLYSILHRKFVLNEIAKRNAALSTKENK